MNPGLFSDTLPLLTVNKKHRSVPLIMKMQLLLLYKRPNSWISTTVTLTIDPICSIICIPVELRTMRQWIIMCDKHNNADSIKPGFYYALHLPSSLSQMRRVFFKAPFEATADVQLLNIFDQTCRIKSSAFLCNDLDFSPYEISLSSQYQVTTLISHQSNMVALPVLIQS